MTTVHWTADPNRLLLPRGQLSGLEREIERDLALRTRQEGRVYRAARDAKPWPEGIPHTPMFEDCWLAGLDERAYLILHGYAHEHERQMVAMRRQAERVCIEARKRERIKVKARQRRYHTTKRVLCWTGRMAAPGTAAWLRKRKRQTRRS